MSWEADLLDYALSGEGDQPEGGPASEGQLDYLEYLVLDGRVGLTKQWEQHYYFVRDRLTFTEASNLIQLIKGFELEPVYPKQKEIGAAVERRVNREL